MKSARRASISSCCRICGSTLYDEFSGTDGWHDYPTLCYCAGCSVTFGDVDCFFIPDDMFAGELRKVIWDQKFCADVVSRIVEEILRAWCFESYGALGDPDSYTLASSARNDVAWAKYQAEERHPVDKLRELLQQILADLDTIKRCRWSYLDANAQQWLQGFQALWQQRYDSLVL